MTGGSDIPAKPPANVLLVDDQPANLLALEAILADLGQNLVKAHSGDEALRHLLAADFAVVLLDVRMPGLNGFEAARLIRGRKRSRHTPLIFLTAAESADFPIIEAYKLGAVDYLVKPLVPEILRAKVAGFVELFQKTEQVKRQAEQLRQLERQEFERRLAEEALRRSEEARAEAERQRDFVRLILEHSPVAIAVSEGPDHRLTLVNPAATALLGLPAGEVGGRTPAEVAPDSGRAIAAVLDRVYRSGRTEVVPELIGRLPDGRAVTLQLVCVPLPGPGGGPAGVLHMAVDLTQRKQAEDALREANRSKDEFLAMLSHELRNPLAPLLTGLQILHQAGAEAVAREQTVGRMERQVRHLSRLVEDLLDASRIAHGKMSLRLERLDLARLAHTAAEDRRALLEQAGLSLAVETPETPLWVTGDATRLAQALNNLLDNAVKFSDAGGRVTVRVAADAARGQAVLTVADAGEGIEPAMLPRLFQPFAQADRSLDRSRGGLGLGLAVVKGLIELHGGEVQAASMGPGKGAVFEVRLPLEPEPAALSEAPARPLGGGGRSKVLVLEDNKDAADSLRMLLEVLGHEARVAYTGPDGVTAAAAWLPEVVISDIGLPGCDGYEVARRLRRTPGLEQVLLVALTGYGGEEDKRLGRAAGFDHHLVKPADPGDLQRVLAARVA